MYKQKKCSLCREMFFFLKMYRIPSLSFVFGRKADGCALSFP